MATEGGQQRELRNDTAVNVVGLLKGQTGATRSYRLLLDSFEADGEIGAFTLHIGLAERDRERLDPASARRARLRWLVAVFVAVVVSTPLYF